MPDFLPEEMIRYGRHFPVIGLEGQLKLKRAKVLCIGAGGLGCPALQYLAASGIGTIGIMDADRIELSNLQRQILFSEQDIGQLKVNVIAARLKAMNQHIQINTYSEFFNKSHSSLLQDYDVILDATDNYEARYTLNDVCRTLKKPLVSASIYQYDAQISVFNYQNGPCYQCLYPTPPPAHLTPNCSIGGVLGVLPGVAGTLQATETIKVILDSNTTLSGMLLCLNLSSMEFNQFPIAKGDCLHHSHLSFEENTYPPFKPDSMTPSCLNELIQSQAPIELIDVREPYERSICHIGGKLIPLLNLNHMIDQLDKNAFTVLYCKSGVRSTQAAEVLTNSNFKHIYCLEGGILKWQETVDSSLMRY